MRRIEMEESKKAKKSKKKSRRLFSDEAEAAVDKREKRIQKAVDKGLRNQNNASTEREVVARRRRRSSRDRDQSTHSQSHYSQDDAQLQTLPPTRQSMNDTHSVEQKEQKKKKGKSKTGRFFSDEAELAQVKKDERIERAIQKEEKRILQRSVKEEQQRARAKEEEQNGGICNDDKPINSRRTFGGEVEQTKAKRERRLQKAVEKEKKKIIRKIEETEGAKAAEAIIFRDDYKEALAEEQRIKTEAQIATESGNPTDVGKRIDKKDCAADASTEMMEPEASASARIDLSSASLNTRRSIATRRLFEPFPPVPITRDRRERPKIKPCAFVDWINVARKKVAVLVHPRLMVNDLSTEQAAEPGDDMRRYGSNQSLGTYGS